MATLPQNLEEACEVIGLLEEELAETNRGLMALTVELEKRVENRTTELRAAHEELQRTNSDLLQLTLELEDRVAQRTDEIRKLNEALEQRVMERTAQLEATGKELSRIFNMSNDLICAADFYGYFKRINPAFTKTLGYSQEELLTRPFLDFVHPDDHAATLGEMASLSEGMPTLSFDNRYRCKDGSYRWLSWTSVPVPEEGLIYAVARDLTQRKEAERTLQQKSSELAQANARLDMANKELEAFSYSVSHDLRAPLRGIDGFSRALEEDYGGRLDDEGKRYIGRIRAGCHWMAQLIDDLLLLSKISRAEIRRQPVDLSALARSIASELSQRDPQREADFAIADGLVAHGDPNLLRVLLDNLIGNSWKFTSKRSHPKIELGKDEARGNRQEAVDERREAADGGAEGQQTFYVRDNGAGFDMAYVDKIFGAFQRLHHQSEFPGTGIGLATVQRVIHRHGGKVWAEGEVDKGATFYFTL